MKFELLVHIRIRLIEALLDGYSFGPFVVSSGGEVACLVAIAGSLLDFRFKLDQHCCFLV